MPAPVVGRLRRPPRLRLPIALAGGAIALVVVLLVGAALDSGDAAEVDVDAVMAAASEAGSGPWVLASQATTLDQLRRAGDAAPAAIASLESQLAEVNRVADGAVRGPLRSFVEAELTLLETLKRLATLDEEQSDRWPSVAAAGREALERVTAASDALPDPLGTSANDTVAEASRAVSALEATLVSMSGRLAEWRTALDAARQARESGRAALEAYAGPFRAQMERYGTLRGAVADYVAGMATTSYTEDLRFFEAARADRHGVREAMSGFTAPEGIAAAHTSVNAAVDRSVGALDAAVDGLRYALTFHVAYTTTEGWLRFENESDEISDAWRAAVAAWDKAVADERARLDAIDDPPRPSV